MCCTTDREYFLGLRDTVRHAVVRGELEQALVICDEAHRWAERHGSPTDVDFVSCSQLAIRLHQGHGDSVIRELQKILMRSSDATIRHLAAYSISNYYELREDFEKSRFYTQLALDHAAKAGSDFYLARTHTNFGNLLIRESHFEDALLSLEKALELFTEEQLYERLSVLTGMGYCHLASGRYTEGFEKLFTVRRTYLRLRMGWGMALGRLRLSFCFGYLEIGKYRLAILHGRAGMEIGERCGDHSLVKKALYLLGEAEKLDGDEMAAYTYYARLQEEFYPDNPYLPDLLLDHDTNTFINLWA
ncbi:MAG TPA: hypothetical protein VGG06_23955 [Thermoanaerobaculia bacterium]|jgi:tetratricopeptide (TPR) repeat protein